MAPLVLGIGAVAISATLFACLLRVGSVVAFLLAAYVFAWAEIVAVVLLLSVASWIERWTLLGSFVVIAAVSVASWLTAGRPPVPSIRDAVTQGVSAARDPLVVVPLAMSAVALLYTLVVSLSTAPNDGDPLAYELTRAAFWRQEHGIVNLEASYRPLDFWPPVAEIGDLVILTLSGTERYTGLAQWLAVPILALATYGVGRRIGLDRRPALWNASLIPTFPVVITQSWASFTDLVFGSFAVTAVYFGLGSIGIELVPLAVTVALAMGTKFLGPIFSPLFLLILALGQPPRRWLPIGAAAVAGAALASLWYLRTLIETGDPVGNGGGGIQSREVAPVVTTFLRLSLEVFDLSGAAGHDAWLYGAVGLIAAITVIVLLFRRSKANVRTLLLAGGLVAAAPVLVTNLGKAYARLGLAVGDALGRSDLVDQLRDWQPSEISDGAYSWFGPIGALLAIVSIPIAVVEFKRHRLRAPAVAMAAAPLIAMGLISVAVAYQRYQGRYFVSAFALCTVIWGGFALRHRWVGAAIVGTAAATVVLTLVNSLGKPSGIGIFRGDPGRSVWSMPRWEQQGILRSTPPERDEVMTMRFVDELVPEDAAIGVSLAYNSFVFPYFGRDLGRSVAIVDDGDVVPPGVDWLVASPGQTFFGCPQAWRLDRRGPYWWTSWKRVGADGCATAVPIDAPQTPP